MEGFLLNSMMKGRPGLRFYTHLQQDEMKLETANFVGLLSAGDYPAWRWLVRIKSFLC